MRLVLLVIAFASQEASASTPVPGVTPTPVVAGASAASQEAPTDVPAESTTDATALSGFGGDGPHLGQKLSTPSEELDGSRVNILPQGLAALGAGVVVMIIYAWVVCYHCDRRKSEAQPKPPDLEAGENEEASSDKPSKSSESTHAPSDLFGSSSDGPAPRMVSGYSLSEVMDGIAKSTRGRMDVDVDVDDLELDVASTGSRVVLKSTRLGSVSGSPGPGSPKSTS